jgi:hypothetical protein
MTQRVFGQICQRSEQQQGRARAMQVQGQQILPDTDEILQYSRAHKARWLPQEDSNSPEGAGF